MTRWRSGDELATFLFKHIPYESIAIYFLGDHDDANGGERFFYNGREWQQLSKPLPPIASESGVAAEEGASPDLPLEQ